MWTTIGIAFYIEEWTLHKRHNSEYRNEIISGIMTNLPSHINFAIREKIWAVALHLSDLGFSPSKEEDQLGHPPSLIRIYIVRMKKSQAFSYLLSAQRRLIRLVGCPADLSHRRLRDQIGCLTVAHKYQIIAAQTVCGV